MRVTDVILNVNQISGNSEGTGISTGMTIVNQYLNGKKTDIPAYLKVETVFPDNKYEKLNVKVRDLKLPLTEEQLKQKREVRIRFKNLTGRFYRTEMGTYELSVSADSMEVLP